MLHLHVEDLFENFETTIRKILEYSGYTLARTNFDEVFSAWRPLQKHYRKQELIDDIVDATINDKYLEWSNLSLIDEAIVQMCLRDLHKLDMMCYNVNVFPTNTTDLRKLLINV
jgi:transcription termination factor NusB